MAGNRENAIVPPPRMKRNRRQDAMNEEEQEVMPSAEELAAALEQMPAWQVDVQQPALSTVEEGLHTEAPSLTLQAQTEMTEPSPPPLLRILEAMLFIGGPPLTLEHSAETVRGLTGDDFHQAIAALNRSYRSQGRPYHIQPQEHGYVLSLRPKFAGMREKLFGGVREARLSQAGVDVLSLVGYRQPTTRQEIDSLRGADSGAILRQLIRHGLIALHRIEGEKEGRYVTTPRFLELFGLSSLDDLPQTQDLSRL